MTSKLSSLTLLAAFAAVAAAQTSTAPKATTATAAHHSAVAKSTTPPNIPKVVGIPRTLYALRYIDIKIGTGPLAQATILGSSAADSKVMQYSVRYTGWLTDGTKFDSSYDHPGGEPFPFPVGVHHVIPGWDGGFQGMHIGGKRRLFIPWQLAYGEKGNPPRIPAKSDLIFDIELVGQEDITSQLGRRPAPPPPSAPAQAPPAGSPPSSSQPGTPPPPATAPQPTTTPQPTAPPHPDTF